MSILVNEDDKSGCTFKTSKTSSKQKSVVTEGCSKWLEGNNSQSSFIFFPRRCASGVDVCFDYVT